MFRRLKKPLKSLERQLKTLEKKFERHGYRSPVRMRRPLCAKVSLIVPTYNVEPYIEEFLASVTSQTTGLRNLEVIIVDDGSTDLSGEIAQAWVRRYPKTIRYIRQENQGLCGARNTGLDHATGEWVSFPDPDDILPRNWLSSFNKELRISKHGKPVLMMARPVHSFREKTGERKQNHPLARLYGKRTRTSTDAMGDYVVLSSATTIVRRSQIEKHKLRFDSRIRPSFEDGHFLNLLIAKSPNYTIARLRKPGYIYRKRDAGTSLLDGAKKDTRWYIDQLRFGYLDLLERTKLPNGRAPRFIQRTVLYDVGWRFSYLVNHAERAAHLTEDQRAEFCALLEKIFTNIDSDTIRSINVGSLTEEYKVGLLAMFKGESRSNDFVYAKKYDAVKGLFQFAFYSGGAEPDVTVFVDGKPAEKIHRSKKTSTFLGRPLFTEHMFWVRVPATAELRAAIAGRPATIRQGGNAIGERARAEKAISQIRPARPDVGKLPAEARALRSYVSSPASHSRFVNCWVFMDRDDVADDNAEHLYRHLLRAGKAEKAFFVLRPQSPDWDRLKAEGFKLLPFGDRDHIAALCNAEILASSHADHFILWPVSKSWIQDLVNCRYAFLQHGVTKDDLSSWLNAKPIELFVTASVEEQESIAAHASNYVFSERETKLTGFPRHDALLERPRSEDTILIMPTWRRYLVGEVVGTGMKRDPLDDFLQSGYAKAWKAFLTSDRLRRLADQHGKAIIFCPHPNMAMYLSAWGLPSYIRCRDPRQPPSLQQTFAETALLVTDYSSVAFECAYIDKPIVYYQFDRNEFFAGDHVYSRGYFDYGKHGFGPLTQTLDPTLDAVEKALQGNAGDEFSRRREKFFAFRDGRCCARVYREISALLSHSKVANGKTKEAYPECAQPEVTSMALPIDKRMDRLAGA